MPRPRVILLFSGLAVALVLVGVGAIRHAVALGAPAEPAGAIIQAVAPPVPAGFDTSRRLSGRLAGLFENMRHSIMLGAVSALPDRTEPAPDATPVASAPIPDPLLPPALAFATRLGPGFVPAAPPLRPGALNGTITLAALEPGVPAVKSSIDSLLDVPAPPVRPASLRAFETEAAITPEPPTAAATPEASEAPAVQPPDRSGTGSFKIGSPAYVRIFKREGQLELWLKRGDRYALFRTYAICKWSGSLGPKLREGDYQSPEGFYAVSARQLNPHSHYDRAFDVGFPNAFDRRQGYTGNAVMVHGDCKSVGCFAMTNKKIEEIYAYVEAAIKNGQREVPVHIFPFRMTRASLARETKGDWTSLWSAPHANLGAFWANMKEGYDLFEQTGAPPQAYACGTRYEFGAVGKSCTRIAGW